MVIGSNHVSAYGNGTKLSIIVTVYNMRREAQRMLYSLSPKYQRLIERLNYEVIVVDNGSDQPLGEDIVRSYGSNYFYYYFEDAPPSPARAINIGAQQASGDILAVMIDGAHILTPGLFYYALRAFDFFEQPVVAPTRWFIGPGQQGETVSMGYDSRAEDALIDSINWPADGYRLFEIGVFIGPLTDWLTGFYESNCLFMRRDVFEAIGGAEERFDYPGGGFLNLDLMREAAERDNSNLVSILGEATFHQVHGGVTNNAPPQERERQVALYREQYKNIRGRQYEPPRRTIEYIGHQPNIERQGLAFKNT